MCACVSQVPERHPDNVPPHPAVPYDGRHHQQRCTKTPASAQRSGESHSTGELINDVPKNV